MAGEIIASNLLLKDRAANLRTFFDSSHSVRLFQTDLHPSPADTIESFVESGFPGYARINLAGKWKAVQKVEDGQYMFKSLDLTFTPTGASNEQAFGWYVVGADVVKISCRLPFPWLMTVGSPLTIRIDCILWAAAIL